MSAYIYTYTPTITYIHTLSHTHTYTIAFTHRIYVYICKYLLSKDKVINLEMSFYLVQYSLVGFSHSYIQTSLCKSLLMAVPPFVFYANFILFPPTVHYKINKWIINKNI
jgi:hypothetical protein